MTLQCMINIRSRDEVGIIRRAGRIVALALETLGKSLKPGITTEELDSKAKDVITKNAGVPAFLGYRGFPGNICTSINEVVVHGIPSRRKLKDGDIISLDIGVKVDGYFADAAATFGVGDITEEASRLIEVTKDALSRGVEKVRAGNRVSDISNSIQTYVENFGFSVVKAFVGHGIGTDVHEGPEIPNFGLPNRGARLEPGMVFAIEPMVNAGTFDIEILDDVWTSVTKDRMLSAHFEHTVVVGDNGPEILTTLN